MKSRRFLIMALLACAVGCGSGAAPDHANSEPPPSAQQAPAKSPAPPKVAAVVPAKPTDPATINKFLNGDMLKVVHRLSDCQEAMNGFVKRLGDDPGLTDDAAFQQSVDAQGHIAGDISNAANALKGPKECEHIKRTLIKACDAEFDACLALGTGLRTHDQDRLNEAVDDVHSLRDAMQQLVDEAGVLYGKT
jgi:hypothetical protein